LTHGVIYAPGAGSEFFCFEPVTSVNDGFNLLARGQAGTGVATLSPGQELRADWTIRVGRISETWRPTDRP
jgi:aldose 1-epimerase